MDRRTSTMKPLPSTIIASALALIAGCETPIDADSRGPAHAVKQVSDTPAFVVPGGPDTSSDKASDFFDQAPTASDPYLAAVNTHVCVLSYIGGNFNGDDEYTNSGQSIINWPDYNYWRLYWRAGTSSARGICTNWNNFLVPSGGIKQVSEGLDITAGGNSNDSITGNGWKGDAITFLAGVNGEIQSNSTYAQIAQATTVGARSVLKVSTDEGASLDFTFLTGFSQSIFAGVPQAQLVRLIGHNTNWGWLRGDVTWTGTTWEFSVNTASGFSSVLMANVNSGICGFTRVAGNFDGAEERVRIEQSGNQWRLGAWAHAGKTVYAKARCMAYDQR